MESGTTPLQYFAAICIHIETGTLVVPPPLHLQAQFPLHEPLVDAHSSKTQRQRLVTSAPPTKGASSSSRPPLRRQLQLASVTKEPVLGASEAEPAMVTAAGERAAAFDKGRGPVGPSLADLAIGSRVPFPPVQAPRASDVRTGYFGLYIAPVNKQPAPAYLLNRTINVKGVPRHSTERWYWSVTLNAVTAAQTTTPTQMHLPCRVTVSEDCGLVAGEGRFFVARFAYRLGSKYWCLDLAVGSEEGGLLARAGSIAFKQVASWEEQGEGFFSEAWNAMRGHVATFHATPQGEDVVDPGVVTDGEVTDGGKSDGARSDRSARSGTGKRKKQAAKDSYPPAPPKNLAGKGNAAAPQQAALGSPLRERSPGTVPMNVYREACRDGDQFRQERDAVRLAAEAAYRLKEEPDTVKRQRDDLQARLVDCERQRAGSDARLQVRQLSKGLKHIESGPGAASPLPVRGSGCTPRHLQRTPCNSWHRDCWSTPTWPRG